MADTLTPTEQCLKTHMAVRFKDVILVFSRTIRGHSEYVAEGISPVASLFTVYTTWVYNLWTEEWRKNAISTQKGISPPGQTAVVIGTVVYIFGEFTHKNMLRRVRRDANGSFVWRICHAKDKTKLPSPRIYHCAWAHREKMWVFGGVGKSIDDYLNDHGTFIPRPGETDGSNNQLFSYNPSTKVWINMKCSGEIPSPRYSASTAIIQDNVWLYGGTTENNNHCNDLYKLNMHSFTWTNIETSMPRPNGRNAASLTPISVSQLVLHGGQHHFMLSYYVLNDRILQDNQKLKKTWIFDIPSHTWRQHPVVETAYRYDHTGITGLNSSVIVLGGSTMHCKESQHHVESTTFCVMLEPKPDPKSLQQMAIRMIYKHRSKLPWENLPKKLTCKIMG